jgi:hypothetical protein
MHYLFANGHVLHLQVRRSRQLLRHVRAACGALVSKDARQLQLKLRVAVRGQIPWHRFQSRAAGSAYLSRLVLRALAALLP